MIRRLLTSRWMQAALVLTVAVAPWIGHAAVTGSVGIFANLQDIRTIGGDTVTAPYTKGFTRTISNGTGANQFNLCWADVRQLTTGANESLDVAGSLSNAFGVVTFSAVKFVSVEAATTNTTTLTVTRPASNGVALFTAASDGLAPLTAGGFFAFADLSATGLAVTAGTADLVFNILNSAGATATYTVLVCGES